MNQRQTYSLALLRIAAYEAYFAACIKMDDTPREVIIMLIKGCNDIEALKYTINLLEDKDYEIH